MRISIVTLFPKLFDAFAEVGVTGRAIKRGIAEIECFNPREFAGNSYGSVDERPYGGGPGMVMMAEPLRKTINTIAEKHSGRNLVVINFSPCGQKLDQHFIEQLTSKSDDVSQYCLICGRYEGIDERFIQKYVDISISLGDFVVSGGELGAFVLLDALLRRLPGTLGNKESSLHDSFMEGMLQYPHYTKPDIFESMRVPSVLKSGNHKAIEAWRREKAIERTLKHRPDLISKFIDSGYFSESELIYIREKQSLIN
tara:strand:+ start:2639 stop:3403 length:765 start_codon:yes stop_codon:yes gene_type:complete